MVVFFSPSDDKWELIVSLLVLLLFVFETSSKNSYFPLT